MVYRESWIDVAKAIGIVLVVFGHVVRGLVRANILVEEQWIVLDSMIYSFHMPLFFLLSGVLFQRTLTSKPAPSVVRYKVRTLLYPYVLWSLLQGSVEVVLSKYTNSGISWVDVLTLWDPRAQFWFLYVLFIASLIVLIIFVLSKKISRLLVFFFVLSIFLALFRADFGNAFSLGSLAGNIFYFVGGVLLRDLVSVVSGEKRFFFIAGSVIFLMLQVYAHATGYIYSDYGLMGWLIAIFGILVVCSLSMILGETSFGRTALSEVGKASLVIFLVHILVGSGSRVILQKFFGVESGFSHLLLGVSLGLAIPYYMYKFQTRLRIEWLFYWPARSQVKLS